MSREPTETFEPAMLYEQLLAMIKEERGLPREPMDFEIDLPEPFDKEQAVIDSLAKRKILRCGRRGGKTTTASIISVMKLKEKHRILYATPTARQLEQFWQKVSDALAKPTEEKVLHKNETMHLIEIPGTNYRIRAKTAWNSDMLRGDACDLLILDEWQLMAEDAWDRVGAPMLLDNNGDAIFLYTPPSLHSRSASKARDPQHAGKMYAKAEQDTTGAWATFHWTSHDNPRLSREALDQVASDMTQQAYRMEIMAEDETEAHGALWKRETIEKNRVIKPPELSRIVVAVDPSATSAGDEAGIVTGGKNGEDAYVLSDDSLQGSPLAWGKAAVTAYHKFKANSIIAEANNGGEMVSQVIAQVDRRVPVKLVHASRGKATRAEPVAAKYEKGKIHHVGTFPNLENEMCLWVPGDQSPNRMDAMVWGMTELILGGTPGFIFIGGRE